MTDEPLTGGRTSAGVARRGETVRRPTGPWSPNVHALLRHLESVGFVGAPRVLGVEGDVEVLTYLDGDVPADPQWEPGRGLYLPDELRSEAALRAAAELLRELHEAAAGFRPPNDDFRFHPHPPRPGEVVSHGDIGPWNTVYRKGLPVALIDWDACEPIEPIVDLAMAAWAFVPLESARQLTEVGFDPVPDLPARLRLFVDSYGPIDRTKVVDALQQAKLRHAERVRYWGLGPADTAVSLEFHAAELRWLDGIAADLERALR